MTQEQNNPPRTTVATPFMKVAPLALVLLYVALALVKIGNPGLQYDEILWGNAALGGVDDTFIIYRIADLPVLLMPYIGAIKSYIYYPIFKLFGVSVFSIRFPAIVMTAAGLYLLWVFLRRALGNEKALAILFLFCVDPSFISQTRLDCGPIVIEFCCKVLALFFLFRLLRRFSYPQLFAFYLVLAIGVFNKLNFVWFVNSLLFAALVVYRRELRSILSPRSQGQRAGFVLANLAGCSILYGYYLFISKTYGLTKQFVFPFSAERISDLYRLFRDMISGVSFYDYALGDLHSPVNTVYFAAVILLLVAGGVVALSKRGEMGPDTGGIYAFFWLIFLTTLLQISVTGQAGANWHMFSVYPAITILVGMSAFLVMDYLRLEGGRRKACAAAAISVVLLYTSVINAAYMAAYDKPTKNIHWSNAVYELIDYARNSPYRFVSVDWGTQAQLITMDPVNGKYLEICYGLDYGIDTNVPGGVKAVMQTLLNEENGFAFIMHPPGDTIFTNPREGMFYEAASLGRRLSLVKTISDGGRVIYEIYVPQKI